ncbi:hypothetical protein KC723_03185 [Candidatus Kaiserbacteria bacterium]|nr:hypothetical protein [Candidatus Kaiserbacteria bacterium]
MEVIQKIIHKSTQENSATKTFIVNMAVSLLIVGVITSLTSVANATEAEEIDIEAENQRCSLLLSSRDGNNAQRTYCEQWLKKNQPTTTIEKPTPEGFNNSSLTKRKQERIINLAANISNQMDATINRLNNISERLESRIAKIQNGGSDVTGAESSLQQAKLRISEAQLKIASIDSEIYNFVTSENPRENWLELKNIYRAVKESISLAHKELVTTVAQLKNTSTNNSLEINSCEVDDDCVFFSPDCEDCTVEAIPLSAQTEKLNEKKAYCEANPPQAMCDLMINGTPKCVAGSCQIVEDNN